MKEIKIVFTRSKKKIAFLSKAIMWWTNKNYSHVARAVQIRDWGYRYYHASEGKVNYEYEKYFNEKHEVVKEYTLSVCEEIDRTIKKACYEEAGNAYGMMQNLGIFLIDIGLINKNPWKKGRNCSELIYLLVLKKLIPNIDYNPDTIKPHEVESIILEHFKENEGVWVVKF